jgi:transglutaminase-like putative cysteine protease
MAEIIREASRDPEIVATARGLVRNLAPGDYASEAAALHRFVRDKIRYTGDPYTEDLYAWPRVTLQQRAGDCNNKVLLFGALARALGFPVRLLFAFKEGQPQLGRDFPAHVLAAVDVYKGERARRQWWPIEATPLPNKTSGFPTVRVPVGFMPSLQGGHVEAVDVDP